jgi:hypothetical protein
MAFILVFKLLISKAYSFDDCQIVVLHVQSKAGASMSALQRAHGSRHDFFIFYKMFRAARAGSVAFLRRPVGFCKCTSGGRHIGVPRKPLANVPFSC